jgi:hypothetical protein
MERRRCDDEFHLAIADGDARHARREAEIRHIVGAMSAFGLDVVEDAWYSGVSGGFWSRANRPGPPIERHRSLKSGYFESSRAQAPAMLAQSAPTSVIALIELR